jgi:hypothetical protein
MMKDTVKEKTYRILVVVHCTLLSVQTNNTNKQNNLLVGEYR